MRVDLFLKKTCLLASRTLAAEACRRGYVEVGGEAVKGSREVAAGDRITLSIRGRVLSIEVLAVPEGNVSRKEARDHYRILSDREADA